MGKLLFNMLSMAAKFEADLIRRRTREGMAVARATSGQTVEALPAQERHLVGLMKSADHIISEVAALIGVSSATVYRAMQRAAKS